MSLRDINKLIRMAADGELDESNRAEFERLKAVSPDETAAGVNVERDLRQLVARAMANDTVPPTGLRQQIREGVRVDLEPWPNVTWRRKSSWLLPSGLAAGLLVVVSAAIIAGTMLSGNSGASVSFGPLRIPRGNPTQTLSEVRRHLTEDLKWGAAVVPEFSSFGYRFLGWTDFQTPPGMATVCQIQYTGPKGVVNVWIEQHRVEDVGLASHMEPNRGHQISVPSASRDGSLDGAYAWIHGKFVYYLTTADPGFGLRLAHAAGMPESELAIIPRQ